MKQDNFIRDAIDESLSCVQFTQREMQQVLHAARRSKRTQARRSAGTRRLQFAFAMCLLAVVVLPLALFTLRAQGVRTAAIHAAPGDPITAVQTSDDPRADRISNAPGYTADESEAIRIARACFEAVCDTSIFTFEEYAVSVEKISDAEYCVTMESIYGNGCSFTVSVSLASGSALRYSTPQLATVPAYLNTDAPEVLAWYEKYGPYAMAWPQDAQAEFSRRYEGGMLRTAKHGELTAEEAEALACEAIRKSLSLAQENSLYGYSTLYAERAGKDGAARYVVSVYPENIADSLPEPLGTVSFKADGSDVAVTLK